jgi:hypothetical protein
MKNTLTVTTEHGTFTRTTARTYAFVVAFRAERHDYIERDEVYYQNKLRQPGLSEREQHYYAAALVQRAQEHIDSDIDANEPFGEKSTVWSSRLDLARKEATKLRERFRDVRIFTLDGQEVR